MLDVDYTVVVGPTYEHAKCQNAGIEMLSKWVFSLSIFTFYELIVTHKFKIV